jgi:3-(3-hydroxy-phenyl)propionate hydroxylase
MSDTDVLVIGGGPVGITTALLLAKRGFSVRVLEKDPDIYDLPRAIAMDDEIQRVFQNAGLGGELAGIVTKMAGAEFVTVEGERIVGLELTEDRPWPLGHHPTVAYYQPQFEAFLREAAVSAGVDLRLGVTADTPSQHDGWVSVDTIDLNGSAEHHTAQWLVAADGASSPTRKHLGISFIDQGFDQDWLVLDVALLRPVPSLPLLAQQICDPIRPTTFIVGHDHYRRWEFQLQPGETREAMTSDRRVWELLAPWISPADADLIRAVVYRFHAMVADRMRAGSIFLAGDAAHQMPPFLGQGLCSGIRDAANLAWKLDLVRRGDATDALLDSYGEERLPHSSAVVSHAVDTGKLIDHLSGRAGSETGIDAGYGGGRPFPSLTTGLLAGDHPAVGRQLPQPRIEGRLLDELLGTGFAVLIDADATTSGPDADPGDVVDQDDVTAAWGGIATTVAVRTSDLPGVLPAGGAVIVRPDRYVAAVAENRPGFAALSGTLLGAMTA